MYFAGRIDETIADCEAAIRGAIDGWRQYQPVAYAYLCLSLAWRGEAEAGLARFDELDWETWAGTPPLAPAFGARGMVRAELGDLAGALEDIETWGRLFPVPNPAFWGHWRSAAAEVLARLGRRDDARELAREELALLGEHATARARGMAQRALALSQVGADQVAGLRLAAETVDRSVSELEQCRTRIELGAALRRAGERVEARAVLRTAAEQADRLGLTALAHRAHEELVASGSRPRRRALRGPQALTPGEARVARMAADGLTNREIAEALFVTPKAVGYHLGNVYRKLEIGGRAQLADALVGGNDEATSP